MAEKDSWPSIKQHGLLTSNEVISRSGITNEHAATKQRSHRNDKEIFDVKELGQIVLRDQVPMPPERLEKALEGGITPDEWYYIINERVFFWAEEHRLLRLLNARLYRDLEHDVLTIDTESLIKAHFENIRICHMNSGNTFPAPHKRGADLFKKIEDYETRANGNPSKPVVEITVLGGVPDISNHVTHVRRMKGSEVLHDLDK